MLHLSEEEKVNHYSLLKLKDDSGNHAPSPIEIDQQFEKKIVHTDACFLSNPYATELFLDFLNKGFNSNLLRQYIEQYPSQNKSIAKKLSNALDLNYKNMIVTNGANEGIEIIINEWCEETYWFQFPHIQAIMIGQ